MAVRRTRQLRLESLEGRRLLAANPLQTDVQLLQRAATSWYVGGERQFVADESPALTWQPVASGDFTADGITDVLGTVAGEWWLQVNDGTQLFGLPWGDNPADAVFLGTGDFNGDGWLDVLSRDIASGDFLVSVNSADGFVVERWGGWTSAVEWSNITIRDFNNDGKLDVLGSEPGGNWWLAKNHGTGFHNYFWGRYQQFDWQDIVNGDFNGDNFSDMAARASDNTWRVWFGSDSGLQLPEYRGHWKMRDGWHDVMAADFDADGRDDLIGRSDDGRLWVATSLEDRFQTRTWATGWVETANWSDVRLVDVDADGYVDQVGKADDGTFWVAKNTGEKMQNHFWGRSEGTPEFVDYVADFENNVAVNIAGFFPGFDANQVQLNEHDIRNPETSDLHISLNEENQIVVTIIPPQGVHVIGIDLQSASGSLVPFDEANPIHPFALDLANGSRQVTVANLGSSVLMHGAVTIGVGWDTSNGSRDLFAQYADNEKDGAQPIPAKIVDERLYVESDFLASSVPEVRDFAQANRNRYRSILDQLELPTIDSE